jgi:hypothetical protein
MGFRTDIPLIYKTSNAKSANDQCQIETELLMKNKSI